jgi:hypothetical protein
MQEFKPVWRSMQAEVVIEVAKVLPDDLEFQSDQIH